MTILDTIVTQKRQEVARRRAITPLRQLQKWPLFNRQPLSASRAITSEQSSGIIAEFKRKSPSRGVINGQISPYDTTTGYVRAGAACLSVLTDGPFFGGYVDDLIQARLANPTTPILRKDFIIDSYQIVEAKAIGADFILLIAACLKPEEMVEFGQIAHALGMEVLLEVHDEAELDSHLHDSVDMVGVNNRNLNTFVTDMNTSVRLAPLIPSDFVKVSESGLQRADSSVALKELGYQGFLIGESLLNTPSPEGALRTLVANVSPPVTGSSCLFARFPLLF